MTRTNHTNGRTHTAIIWINALIWVAILCLSAAAGAQQAFHVQLNTAPLIGNANSPFSLDFQLTDGSGTNDANNTVMLSNVTFGVGGGATGSPTQTGGASGALSTTVTLTDSQFFNELYQTFTPGDLLDFDVNLTTNADAGLTPDLFSFGILDGALANLPTMDAGNALLIVEFGPAPFTVQTFSTTAPYIPVGTPLVTFPQANVPEPGALALSLGIGLFSLGLIWQRRSHQQTTNHLLIEKSLKHGTITRGPHGADCTTFI